MKRHGEHEFVIAARQVGQQLATAFQPVVPFLLQAGASMGAFTAGLAAAQGMGMAMRVSCATPVVGPIGGLLGVGLASAAAGQASIKTRQYLADRKMPGVQAPLFRGVRSEDLIVDALLGIAFFKVMGGRFRSVMPSDVAKVGAIARESMPAAGVEYATEKYRIELRRLFRRDGCHHCGTRRGAVIGDHMPPNKYVKEYVKTAERAFFKLPFVKKAAEALAIPTGPPKQRYYPQCKSCCEKQSVAIRNDKLKLIFHEVLHHGGRSQAWHYAGTLLGLRHYSGSAGGSSGGYGGTGRRR